MTLYEAIALLETYQTWRRGAEIEQPNPKQVGIAIDLILREVKKNYLLSDEVTNQVIP